MILFCHKHLQGFFDARYKIIIELIGSACVFI